MYDLVVVKDDDPLNDHENRNIDKNFNTTVDGMTCVWTGTLLDNEEIVLKNVNECDLHQACILYFIDTYSQSHNVRWYPVIIYYDDSTFRKALNSVSFEKGGTTGYYIFNQSKSKHYRLLKVTKRYGSLLYLYHEHNTYTLIDTIKCVRNINRSRNTSESTKVEENNESEFTPMELNLSIFEN